MLIWECRRWSNFTCWYIDLLCRYYTSLEVASEYFRSGADKISIGSDAVYAAEEYLKSGVCDTHLCESWSVYFQQKTLPYL